LQYYFKTCIIFVLFSQIDNMNKETRNNFVRLAEKRVTKAIKDIKLIGNLSNKSNYSYSEDDIAKIHKALRKAVDDCKNRFERSGSEEDEIFKL
jgi:hypothetical protein